ncbi:MAG: flavohemoglobin expression-modulating QEGLA motif protein [Pseudomonadota bacterium]|nr:flavohemoglobin expression-modulating QEGLA motif protein [Pseudomonadota bacterium]
MTIRSDIARYAELDARMVRAARGIKLLGMVSWPASVQDAFLAQWRAGGTSLPRHDYPKHDFGDTRRELDAVAAEAALEPGHPLAHYLVESTRSWSIAAELLESLGTPTVCTLSQKLYGGPNEALPGNGPTTRDAARHFIDIANELDHELLAPEENVAVSATALRLQLQSDLDDFFDKRVIEVVLDPDLIAKAAAGATRIRLRAGAAFSDYDRQQLLQHEAFVHSLTGLNGREQPVLKSLALSSPRTTATQEGLATFAEQITGAIDIERMKRVSLRIEAVAMALAGADFVQVFRYFIDGGQGEVESFSSAQRVFRGVPVTGGHAFTKDVVYLRGLVGVHTYFRWALKTDRLHLCRQLFAGKMTLDDAVRFEPLFKAEGDAAAVLAPPRWLPRWLARANGLAGMLAFSLFANQVRMDQVGIDQLE